MKKRLTGLIAATFTPMRADGELNLDVVVPTVEHLVDWNIGGLYVTGSTGEGVSLTDLETETLRQELAEIGFFDWIRPS